jgi:hypothetical protein
MTEDARRSLAELDAEEREVSARRSRLHEQIDFLRSTGMAEPDVEERLAALLERERSVSERRRELHALIDRRRAELGIAERGPVRRDTLRDER